MRNQHSIHEQLHRIERKLNVLLLRGFEMGKEMDDLRAAVAAQSTVGDSVVTLLNDITQRLKDAVASGDPAELNALLADITANNTKLAEAVTKNTPVASEPPPVVPPVV